MTTQHINQRDDSTSIKLSLSSVNVHKSTYSWSTLQTKLYSVIKPAVYQKDHQNFYNIFHMYFHMFVAKHNHNHWSQHN